MKRFQIIDASAAGEAAPRLLFLRVCRKTSAGREAYFEQNDPHPACADRRGNSQTRLSGALLVFLLSFAQTQAAEPLPAAYTIPVVDISADTNRHVIVDREPCKYLGHP